MSVFLTYLGDFAPSALLDRWIPQPIIRAGQEGDLDWALLEFAQDRLSK